MASCPSCHAADALVYSEDATGIVCISCGGVAPEHLLTTFSNAFKSNLLAIERAAGHVDGFIQIDNEGEFDIVGLQAAPRDDRGRTMLTGGGFTFGENSAARMVGTDVRKLGAKEEYQGRNAVSRWLHSILSFKPSNSC